MKSTNTRISPTGQVQQQASKINIFHSNAMKRPVSATSSQLPFVKNKPINTSQPYVKSAIVFAYSLNDIIKSHLANKKFRTEKDKIEVHFTQKVCLFFINNNF